MGRLTAFILIFAFCFIQPIHADVLLLEGISKEPSNDMKGVPRPTQGMSANTVKEKWGVPKSVTEPVGSPPISRWEYDKFFVFFEKENVIHSVYKKKKEKELYAKDGE